MYAVDAAVEHERREQREDDDEADGDDAEEDVGEDQLPADAPEQPATVVHRRTRDQPDRGSQEREPENLPEDLDDQRLRKDLLSREDDGEERGREEEESASERLTQLAHNGPQNCKTDDNRLSSGAMKLSSRARFQTICIHAGQEPDRVHGRDHHADLPDQSRTSRRASASTRATSTGARRIRRGPRSRRNLAAIEGGRAAFAFASGMAAIDAIVSRYETGDHLIVTDNTYGGTFRLFDKVCRRHGITFTYVDTADLQAVERAFTPQTKLVFVETPTNPVLKLTDIAALSALAHHRGVPVAVDNTFASPVLQRPLALGADLVTHSTTKYLNGHSDSIGGVVIARRDDDIEWLRFIQNAAGAILSPMDSWLVLRGTKTLPLRMVQHSENGLALARVSRDAPEGQPASSTPACRPTRSTSWRAGRCPTAVAACSRSTSRRSTKPAASSTASS